MALVGGSALTRAVVSLTTRAIALTRQDVQPLTFVASEATVRQLFDGLRRLPRE